MILESLMTILLSFIYRQKSFPLHFSYYIGTHNEGRKIGWIVGRQAEYCIFIHNSISKNESSADNNR